MKCKYAQFLLKTLGVSSVTLALLFVVYYFNLDMKLMRSVVLPFMDKYFDRQQPQRII